MNKPAILSWSIIVLVAGFLIFLSAHSCTAPKPVIQDVPAERVPPIAERITEPEAPPVAKPVHRHVARAETCRPNGIDCGAILTVNGAPGEM